MRPSQLRTRLANKPEIADFKILNLHTTDRIEGIIDVYKNKITNERTFCEQLNNIVTITDHGKPVRQRKLGNGLTGPRTETYNRTIYRYEFVTNQTK